MEKTICIFGDSIAWGAWDREGGGWCARLRKYFETNNFQITIYNCSVDGDSTRELLKRFKFESEVREPDIVIFAIGINDSYYYGSKSSPSTTTEKFENNLSELIKQASESVKIIFIGLTPVDESRTRPVEWATSIFHDQENTLQYNSIIEEVCSKNDTPFINIIDNLELGDIEDGIHPNAQGHKKIFLKVKDFLISNKFLE